MCVSFLNCYMVQACLPVASKRGMIHSIRILIELLFVMFECSLDEFPFTKVIRDDLLLVVKVYLFVIDAPICSKISFHQCCVVPLTRLSSSFGYDRND